MSDTSSEHPSEESDDKKQGGVENRRQARFWWKLSRSDRLPRFIVRFAWGRYRSIHSKRMASRLRGKASETRFDYMMPDGEKVEVPRFWVSEVYTPTTIDLLYSGLRLLYRKSARYDKVEEVIRGIATSRQGGLSDFQVLPSVVERKAKLFIHRDAVEATLPNGITQVNLSVWCITSTITVVVAEFIVGGEKNSLFDELLRTKVSSEVTRERSGGVSMIFDDVVYGRNVHAWRSELLSSGAQWFSHVLPGSFAKLSPRQFPTIEMLQTKELQPWQPENDVRSFSRVLGLDALNGYWQCRQLKAFRMNVGYPSMYTKAGMESLRNVIVLATRRDKTTEGPESDVELRLSYGVQGFAVRWGIYALVVELEVNLANIQDLAEVATQGRSPKKIEELRQQLLRNGIYGQMVADDIATIGAAAGMRVIEPFDFTLVGSSSDSDGVEFAEMLAENQTERARKLVDRDSGLRQLLGSAIELAAVVQNLKLQRLVIVLTVVSLVVAIAAIVLN